MSTYYAFETRNPERSVNRTTLRRPMPTDLDRAAWDQARDCGDESRTQLSRGAVDLIVVARFVRSRIDDRASSVLDA